LTAVTTAQLNQKAKRPLLSGLKIEKAQQALKKNRLWDLETALDFSMAQMQQESPIRS